MRQPTDHACQDEPDRREGDQLEFPAGQEQGAKTECRGNPTDKQHYTLLTPSTFEQPVVKVAAVRIQRRTTVNRAEENDPRAIEDRQP